MNLLWWRRRKTDRATELAAEQDRELERIRSQWPTVEKIAQRQSEHIRRNHLGQMVTGSFHGRHA